jgi:hypothetical protein
MKASIFFIVLFFFFSKNSILFAQISETGQITGIVIDSLTKGEMPFANITIQQNGKEITGVQSTKNGVFITKKIAYGEYDIKIQYIGYQTYITKYTLKTPTSIVLSIKMLLEQINLAEIKVVGKKPFLEQSIDKMILNVSESITGAGGFATDLLRRVPGMSIGDNGLLIFRGRTGTQVMIDGKLINLSADEIGKLLESMPTGSIDKIEIITNPSAKYEAEGRGAGVINIKTLKGKMLGLNGSVNGGIGMGEKFRYNGGIDLNYRSEKYKSV